MHYSMVIVLKQDLQVDLIWCDSLQRDGRQPLNTYAQYYHFLEMEMTRSQVFQPTRHYTSMLRMRTHTPALSRQCNGTDCGIFTLLYQQAVSNWYGAAAGQTFTDAQIQALLNSLDTINQDAASRHREWIRIHMHTWWRGKLGRCRPNHPAGRAPTAGATETPTKQGAGDLHSRVSANGPLSHPVSRQRYNQT